MKKMIFCFMLFSSMFFFNCTTTIPAVSLSAIDNTNNKIADSLKTMGYELSGKQTSQTNELHSVGVSYSKYSGYGTALSNDYWRHQTLTFLDSSYNSVSYTFKYQLVTNSKGENIIRDFEMTSCSASKDYKKICNEYGLIQKAFSECFESPDITIEVPDKEKSMMGLGFGLVGGGMLLTCLLLLLLL